MIQYFQQAFSNNNLWIPKQNAKEKIEKLKDENGWNFDFLTPFKNDAELSDDLLRFLLCYDKFDNVSAAKLS